MNCPACGHENAAEARFCEECAADLALTCTGCGASNAPTARFCNQCRSPLGQGAMTSVPEVVRKAVALPAAFAGGRYQVRSFLGEGAKKRVYLAHDTKLDRDVAFALIKADGLDADGLVRVRREAQAMGRLGDHAHIVTIFDTGDEAGAPFIVSQLMPGGSLEDLLAKAEQHRIPAERAMKVAAHVCQALAHAHGRGIVHRDLKPGNVWLDDDMNAALGDFGLAVAVDRSRMTMQGMMVGTVAYMAPEQALGRTPDARSDLYGLGAMLYEMVCGRAPFLGDDAVGVISQHINTPPVAPSWHEHSVPKPLDALIMRLLEKSPDERPASAHDVATELRRILERSTVTEHPEARQPDAVGDLRALNWGWFVGRREEMDQLKDALEGALSGKGALAMLVGEPGIGKTRLAEEFGVYAGLRGAQVLTGHCYEGESSLPYRPFIEAFRQYTRSRPDAELRLQLGPGAPEIATLVSEIRQRFPDLEEAPKLDPEAERLRLFESVTEFVRNASAGQPLVLHLDDLHWSDKPSLLLLQHLAQRTARERLLILGAYRDVELERTHPLAESLGAFRRLPNFRRVVLRGLPQESVVDLLTVIDPSEEGAPAREALAAALFQETEGNPFFIREVLAHLIETGKIVHEGGRWVGKVTSIADLGIPEGVREVIGRRLSQLSDACNRMLTLASTMTGGFTWEALKAINADVPEGDLLDLLEEALAKQMIAERRGEHTGTYDFTHALIRQTLYDELSTPRRVLLHRQIGESLERLYASNLDAHLPELAHHFYQAAPGGDVEKAIDYARRAGERAISQFAFEESVVQYRIALQACDLPSTYDDGQRVELLVALGDVLVRTLQSDEALATADRAVKLAEELGDAELYAAAAVAYAIAANAGPNFGKRIGVPILQRALARVDATESPVRARLMLYLVDAMFDRLDPLKHVEERRLMASDAKRIADACRDEAESLHALRTLSVLLEGPEHTEERLRLSRERLALAKNHRWETLWAHLHLVMCLAELGEIDELRREVAITSDLADQMREPGYLGWRPIWDGMFAIREGRFADAERSIQQVFATAQRTLHPNYFASAAGQIAALRWDQGRLGELESIILQQLEDLPGQRTWQAVLAVLYAESDRFEEARRWFDEMATNNFDDVLHDVNWTTTFALVAYLSCMLSDATRGEVALRMLKPYATRGTVAGFAILCQGSASSSLGDAATACRRFDEARDYYEYAIDWEERTGARPRSARSRLAFAQMLQAEGRAGYEGRALELVNEALTTFEDLGMPKFMERALALKLELQGARSSGIYTSIDRVARAVEQDRPQISVHPAPDGTVTLMFSDIEDSTVLTERMGDEGWQELLRKHNALIREQLRAYDGYEVKTMGDGFMVAFQSAKKGLECAIAIQRAFAEHNTSDGEHVKVRIGLHAGEAIKDGDDFYGKNVIMASRVAGKAVGGEILVSSLVRGLVESRVDASTFGEPREVELKGLEGRHAVHAIAWPA